MCQEVVSLHDLTIGGSVIICHVILMAKILLENSSISFDESHQCVRRWVSLHDPTTEGSLIICHVILMAKNPLENSPHVVQIMDQP